MAINFNQTINSFLPQESDLAKLPVKLRGNSVKYIKSQEKDALRQRLRFGIPAEVISQFTVIPFEAPYNPFLCYDYVLARIFDPENPATGAIGTIENPLVGPSIATCSRARTKRLIEDYFTPTLDPEEGDLVIYSDKNKNPLHFGVYKGQGRVESKWGGNGVFEHPLFQVPLCYGKLATFYKNTFLNEGGKLKKMVISELKNASFSPLHHLIFQNKLEEAKGLLLKNPSLVNSISAKDESPLLIACRYKRWNFVQDLLDSKANVNLCESTTGWPPISIAAQHNQVEVIDLLIKYNASVQHISEEARTPLHFAAANGHTETIAVLIREGADWDAKDSRLNTPLHRAAAEGHLSSVDELLKLSEASNWSNDKGKTPFSLAAENNHGEVLQRLIEHDHSLLKQVDSEGRTSLHLAAMKGAESSLRVLIQANANLATLDSGGKTALMYAEEQGNETCVQLLKEGNQ